MIKTYYSRGFSLLEVLVATFILTFGVLGMIGVYMNALRRVKDSYWYTLANSHLISMSEKSRVSVDNFYTSLVNCQSQLPKGECKLEGGMIEICWQENNCKTCLSKLKVYGS